MSAITTLRDRVAAPRTIALVTVGLALAGLLIGYEPVGGDPDRMYRPIKSELARALRDGRLPFWSDRFGLGVPLVAESHVAAFYPPNWVLYRALDVSAAYRLSMWLHYLLLVAATYAYACRLGLTPWGSALAALAFTLCGAQAIHSSHEPIYSALPFLPLALLVTEHYLATGRVTALGVLALTWAAQLTVGHFQIQMWTAGLVLMTGLWRVVTESYSRWRALALAGALICGGGIAAMQLVPSWNQAQLVGSTERSLQELLFFSYPPAHWAELAIPRLFHGLSGGPEDPYWFRQGTTGYEACLYVGTVPLILAIAGLTDRRDRALALWRMVVPASFALATMPRWWPGGYQALLHLPGLALFRAPGRYTIITSLGLALLAGRGFDRSIPNRRFAIGIGVAVAFATSALAWAFHWAQLPDYRVAASDADVRRFVALAVLVWVSSLAALLAWRARKLGAGAPFIVAAVELVVLFYNSTTVWSRSIALPAESPVLRRLAREPNVGTVAGYLDDLPVRADRSPTYPYLGMRVPPPNSLLEFARSRDVAADPRAMRILRRYGVTHGVWDGLMSGSETLYAGADEALDRLVYKPPGAPEHSTWYLVRYAGAAPAAHVALRALEAPDMRTLLAQLAQTDAADVAWFLSADRPSEIPGPRARSARIVRWDGLEGEVDHDGTCDVVIRRTYAPGWTARINDGPEVAVVPVDGGLQSVRVPGSGRSRISVRYRPPRWRAALAVAVVSLAGALFMLAGGRRPSLAQLRRVDG